MGEPFIIRLPVLSDRANDQFPQIAGHLRIEAQKRADGLCRIGQAGGMQPDPERAAYRATGADN